MHTVTKSLLRCSIVVMSVLQDTPTAKAGSWSSGGGEILEHATNPWFLDSGDVRDRVKYCVIEGNDFPLRTPVLQQIVRDTIRWWDVQFGNAFIPDNWVYFGGSRRNLKIAVKTSGFSEKPCDGTEDLAFQFGYVTEEQRLQFQDLKVDLTRYAALSIRSDYSDELRGKGFIYVSPDRGPSAFRGDQILPEAWTSDDTNHGRLRSVLAHELGHVFGLPHDGALDSIMSARFAELVVSKAGNIPVNLIFGALGAAVFFPRVANFNSQNCGLEKPEFKDFRDYFAISEQAKCFKMIVNLNEMQIFTKDSDDQRAPWDRVGKATFADGGQRRHQQRVNLWLPNTQRMFPGLNSFYNMLNGPASTEVQQQGIFVDARSGRRVPIFIQASPRYLQIGGATEQRIIPDLLPKFDTGRVISGWQQE